MTSYKDTLAIRETAGARFGRVAFARVLHRIGEQTFVIFILFCK